MDIQILKLNYAQCGQDHVTEIDFDTLSEHQHKGLDPVLSNFICPDVAWMYKVFGFALDTRVRILNNDSIKKVHGNIIKGLKDEWGKLEFSKKLERFKELGLSFLGILDEYYNLLWDVVSNYCCGRFYSAMTSAGALGERILNCLIIKARDYHKASHHCKIIYRKTSFDQWENQLLF